MFAFNIHDTPTILPTLLQNVSVGHRGLGAAVVARAARENCATSDALADDRLVGRSSRPFLPKVSHTGVRRCATPWASRRSCSRKRVSSCTSRRFSCKQIVPHELGLIVPSCAVDDDDLPCDGNSLAKFKDVARDRSAELSTPPRSTSTRRSSSGKFCAATLARKHHVGLFEAKRILEGLEAARRNEHGGLGMSSFQEFMRRIFDAPDSEQIDENVVRYAYKATNMQNQVDPEAFVVWYVQNMFTHVTRISNSIGHKVYSI